MIGFIPAELAAPVMDKQVIYADGYESAANGEQVAIRRYFIPAWHRETLEFQGCYVADQKGFSNGNGTVSFY